MRSERQRRTSRAALSLRIALLAGLAFLAVAVALTLSRAPSVVAGSNAVPIELRLGRTAGPVEVCQSGETLPRDTYAIRLSLESPVGPRITLEVLAAGRLITGGIRGSGWTGGSVTISVKPLPRTVTNVELCFAAPYSRVHLAAIGARSKPAAAARSNPGGSLGGRVRSEYLRAGKTSWWSLAASVARRMGLGRAAAGTWVAALTLALALAVVLLATGLSLVELTASSGTDGARATDGSRSRRFTGRLPAAAWVCAAVACLNAICWSVITPPFQVPDEPSHFAYVQLLAERARLPSTGLRTDSPALLLTLDDLHSLEVRYNPSRRSIASEAEQRKLERDQAAPYSEQAPGGGGVATAEPPLYYALEAIPYALASSGSLLDRLELMRLLSALMAAVTALFGYLFIREALPGSRAAWTVGGLAVALFPLLGFMSGGVNPDALLFALCAALYYCFARAFRRGLTSRLAITIGALVAAGLLTKLNFVGFAPGAIAGLLCLSVRRSSRAQSQATGARWRSLALALSIAASPVVLYAARNLISGRPAFGAASAAIGGLGGDWLHRLSYVWQFYLPRLPGMPSYFPGVSTWRQLWFDGLVGFYGWADTLFAGWVYDLALVPAAAIALLCVRELARRRAALRRRGLELGVYLLTGVGVMAVVGVQSYASDVGQGFEPFWEPRYLLPMLALWGCVVALATRGAGRRWGPAVGALLITLFLAHDVFSQLQVIARYYG